MRNDILASHGTLLPEHFDLSTDVSFSGSIQSVYGIPEDLKAVFRTAFELDPHDLIDMAADRAPFIDQSQSFSLFVAQPTPPYLVNEYTTYIDNITDGSSNRWNFNFMRGVRGLRPARTMSEVNPLLTPSPSAYADPL